MKRRVIFLFSFLAISFGMALPAPAQAIYSPTIYDHVQTARRHLQEARAKNGAGTAANAWDQWSQREKELTAKDPKHARVSPPQLEEALQRIRYQSPIKNDSIAAFYMLFGWAVDHPYSACVRNDVFEIEDVIGAVSNEMLRMAILFDQQHFALLKQDHLQLRYDIDYLQQHSDDSPTNADGVAKKQYYLFPEGGKNYYLDGQCPENEWDEAAKDFVKSITYVKQTLEELISLGGWGSIGNLNIGKIAQKRAEKRAAEWIRKNKLQVSIGGETGAKTSSLRNNGMAGVWTSLNQQVETLIGPLATIYDLATNWSGATCAVYRPALKRWDACSPEEVELFKGCKEKKKDWYTLTECQYFAAPNEALSVEKANQRTELQKQAKAIDLEKARRAVRYQLHFNTISANAEIDFDNTFVKLNNEISGAYTRYSTLPGLIEQFSFLEKRFCPNKVEGLK